MANECEGMNPLTKPGDPPGLLQVVNCRMYRFFLLLAVIIATAICLYTGAAWYAPALTAAALGVLLPVWRRGGFWFAFLGGVLVWGIYTGYLHLDSEGRLSDRLAITFGVGSGWALVGVTALWGGITTGLGAWFGVSLRKVFEKTPAKQV
ncbi:MAG: hypothetical protein ACI81P_000612 [Neolewinella sp.]|jgi:hypothetical protein